MGPARAVLLPRTPHRLRAGLRVYAARQRLYRTHLQPRRRSPRARSRRPQGSRPLSQETLYRRDRATRADGGNPTNIERHITMINLIAEITGSIQGGLGCLGA